MRDKEGKRAIDSKFKKDFYLTLAKSVQKKIKRMVLRRRRFLRVW